ncbi:hypothetical protein LguiB_027110 [Lonicera macranthoides]
MVWNFDRLGNYNTKSGYHLARSLFISSGSASLGDSRGPNSCTDVMKLWRPDLPTKVKLFMWCVWIDLLPTFCEFAI